MLRYIIMTTFLAEVCTDASQDANLRLPYAAGSLAIHVGSVFETQLLFEDPALVSRSLSLQLAGGNGEEARTFDPPALRIQDIHRLRDISTDTSLSKAERVGALTVLSCLASAYSPQGLEDRKLDALSGASFSALLQLSQHPTSREGRFAGQVLEWLVADSDRDMAEDAAEFFAEVAELSGGTNAPTADTETAETPSVRQTPIEVASLGALPRMPWINKPGIEKMAASDDGFSGEVVIVEGRPVAVVCDLTPFNRRTKELADDVSRHGKREAAWQYATRGVARLTQGETQPPLKGAPVPTLMGGNRKSNSDNFLRTYYVHMGHQDGLPVYGVIGIVRTKANQDSLLRLILPGNFRAREA